jgi:hypothetical protein
MSLALAALPCIVGAVAPRLGLGRGGELPDTPTLCAQFEREAPGVAGALSHE